MKPFGLLLLVMAVIGCNPQDASHIENDAQTMAKDAGQAAGSITLAGKVNTVLFLRKGLDMSGVHLDAADGVVTVSGHVPDASQKQILLSTIDEVKGVDKVIDKVRLP